MSDSYTPGQDITCTITKTPRNQAGIKTLARLMRQDPTVQRSQRRAQDGRRSDMVVYTRGGRDWYKRAKCGKGVKVRTGETWKMTYVPQLQSDLASVSEYIEVKAG